MSFYTVLLIGLTAWLSILVVVLAMCRAAAHADGKLEHGNRTAERISRTSAAPAPEAPAPDAIAISHS